MSYELILFDADKTLFDFNKTEEFALEKAFDHHNISYDKGLHLNTYRKINESIWLEFEEKSITLEELKAKRFKRLFKTLDIEHESKDFNDVYLSYLSQGSFLIEEAEEIVSSLSKKYRIAIITNGISSVQIPRLNNSPILPYIEEMIISEDVGYPKPNKEIFEFAFEKLGHKDKNKALIVGDSLSSDIKGGYLFGIDTCWYNPYKIKNTGEMKPTYEIHSLRELKEILD